jgi:hypothetical protein
LQKCEKGLLHQKGHKKQNIKVELKLQQIKHKIW